MTAAKRPTIFTVGHSNHTMGEFLSLLHSRRKRRVDEVVDIRSVPYSNYAPHFNRDALREIGIGYEFLGGGMLGGRPTDRSFYNKQGRVLYIDIRLNNKSQLSGFAKGGDLEYFLDKLCGMKYVHMPELLAPTKEMLDSYRKEHRSWETYESEFLALMEQRRIEKSGIEEALDNGCLLCSEDKPDQCHRRLIAEYLRRSWGDVEIIHLG